MWANRPVTANSDSRFLKLEHLFVNSCSPPGRVRWLDDGFTSPQSGRRIADCPLLNDWSPRNGAFGDRRIISLIGVTPIPDRGCWGTGIWGVIVAVIIATIIGSGR